MNFTRKAGLIGSAVWKGAKMQKEDRELLLRTAGIVDGLFMTAPEEMKDALEIISNNIDYVLTHESEDTE